MNDKNNQTGNIASDSTGLFCVFHGEGGWDTEREHAKKHLKVDQRYRVRFVEMGQSETSLHLEGVPYKWGSGMFDVNFDKLRKMVPKIGDTYHDPDEGEFIITGLAVGGVIAKSVSGHIGEHYVSFELEESEDDEDEYSSQNVIAMVRRGENRIDDRGETASPSATC
ncbi:hypothetical protein [Luteolibacter sp. AS25]|uniref:hypothetical protein n=1 Tax=Luteolibacter sp. AS25 TaxID=3135776 RepID=UPI00398AB968